MILQEQKKKRRRVCFFPPFIASLTASFIPSIIPAFHLTSSVPVPGPGLSNPHSFSFQQIIKGFIKTIKNSSLSAIRVKLQGKTRVNTEVNFRRKCRSDWSECSVGFKLEESTGITGFQ